MDIYFIIIVVLFGFIMGSFLNVVSLRFNTGKSLNGRSMCFSCSKKLSWYELIPVVSWIIQGGRCRTCSSRIPFELLASELLTGLFFGLIAARGFFVNNFQFNSQYIISTAYLLVVFSVLIVILFYDLRHKIIPDLLSLYFALLAFISIFFFGFNQSVFTFVGFHVPQLWHGLAGILIPLPFVLIWILSKGKLIGLGDPKLMVGIGLFLGVSMGFTSIFISFWIGGVFSLAILLINKFLHKKLLASGQKSIMKTEIPFAPFLILGFLITIILNINVLGM